VSDRRAALYTRVSSASQVDNYSLEDQERQLHDYCGRYGIAVAGVYRDAGISGSTIADRPAIRELLQDGEQGKFDEVLIYKVDRFTRADPWDLYPLVKGLLDLHIKLTSATEAFDLTDDNGQLIFSILANFAARERRLIVQRTGMGKRARAREGKFTGGKVPFGYAVDPDTGHFVPDTTVWWREFTRAEVVRLIFERYVHERGAPGVTRWLLEQGVPAPNRVWNPSTVRQMVANPVYRGDFAWGKRSHQLHQRSRKNAPQEWIVTPGVHQPLVSIEVWDTCARVRREVQRGGRRQRSEPRLLGGFLECSRCGSALTPRTNEKGFSYTCASRYNAARRRDGTACMGYPSWPGEKLDEFVWKFVVEAITDDDMLERVRGDQGKREERLREATLDLQRTQRELADVEGQQDRLLDLVLGGTFRPELLDRKQTELERRRQAASEAVRRAQERLDLQQGAGPSAETMEVLRSRLRAVLSDGTTVDERRAFLREVLGGRIVVEEQGQLNVAFRVARADGPDVKGGRTLRRIADKPSVALRPARSPATR